jgi:hypothetical protein
MSEYGTSCFISQFGPCVGSGPIERANRRECGTFGDEDARNFGLRV